MKLRTHYFIFTAHKSPHDKDVKIVTVQNLLAKSSNNSHDLLNKTSKKKKKKFDSRIAIFEIPFFSFPNFFAYIFL